jgi:hypothetical protein
LQNIFNWNREVIFYEKTIDSLSFDAFHLALRLHKRLAR